MAIFQVRLVERVTKQGSADFRVEATSAEEAATTVVQANLRAQANGSHLITLPDGQFEVLESETEIARETALLLLDNDGVEVSEIAVPPSVTRLQ
jgi:hypothetical protein